MQKHVRSVERLLSLCCTDAGEEMHFPGICLLNASCCQLWGVTQMKVAHVMLIGTPRRPPTLFT